MQPKDHAAANTLPLAPKERLICHSNNPAIIKARKKINALTRKYSINKSRIIRKHLQAAKNDLEEQYKCIERDHLMNLIAETECEFMANNTAKAWKVVNTITNRKITPSGKIKGKTTEERKDNWFNHFRNLLGKCETSPPVDEIPIIHQDTNIFDGEFSIEQLKEVRKQLRDGKAPGEDGIMPELILLI